MTLNNIIGSDYRSITPGWVLHNYPEVEFVVKLLRHNSCSENCVYCNTQLNVLHNLKTFFGYEQFRTYEGEPLQEQAAQAAVKRQITIGNISYRWRKIAYFSIARTYGRTFCARTHNRHFATTIIDERSGG